MDSILQQDAHLLMFRRNNYGMTPLKELQHDTKTHYILRALSIQVSIAVRIYLKNYRVTLSSLLENTQIVIEVCVKIQLVKDCPIFNSYYK